MHHRARRALLNSRRSSTRRRPIGQPCTKGTGSTGRTDSTASFKSVAKALVTIPNEHPVQAPPSWRLFNAPDDVKRGMRTRIAVPTTDLPGGWLGLDANFDLRGTRHPCAGTDERNRHRSSNIRGSDGIVEFVSHS